MITRAERESLVAEAERTISAGSKSFRFASRLFDGEVRERSWLLYAWCRACDDMIDGQTLGHDAVAPADGPLRVARVRELTDRVLAGERVGIPAFDGLPVVVAETGIPRCYIDHHVEGFALDAAGWRPAEEKDLLRYCYHVAGAVGCMMAVVMGVGPDEEKVLGHASDLGIAFQLANVARDLVEDHGSGRTYLPSAWLKEAGIEPGDLAQPENRALLADFAARLARLAEPYQESARIGAARLPVRSRWAVLSAANIYGDIGRKVVALGPGAWDQRTSIGKPAKFVHVVRALIDTLR